MSYIGLLSNRKTEHARGNFLSRTDKLLVNPLSVSQSAYRQNEECASRRTGRYHELVHDLTWWAFSASRRAIKRSKRTSAFLALSPSRIFAERSR